MRYLGRAKQKNIDYDYITVDIETGKDKKYNSALLGEPVYISWCENGNGFGEKSNDLTLWLIDRFLIASKTGYIMYAHNGFGFDMKRIDWKLLIEYGYTVDFLTGRDGSIKSATVSTLTATWIIRDSLLLIPRKLDEVTAKFAPEFRKLKREKSFDEYPFNPEDKDDTDYAIQDSVGLWYALKRVDSILQDRFNVSIHESPTLPGLAFRAFRLLFKPKNKEMEETAEKYPGLSWGAAVAARESYHGGQTIAFRTNAFRDIVSIDANSMYSFVMLNWKLPTGEVRKFSRLPPDSNPNRTLCLAVCHIPSGVFPVLKTKNKKGGVGNYNGVVAGWYWLFELEKQKELGGSYEVVECYVWEDDTECASRFIALCRQLRMEDYFGAIGEIAKLLGNAVYGKFAQMVAEYTLQLAKNQPDESFPVYDPVQRRTVAGLWQVKSQHSFSADMTHWASFITAKARMVLNDGIQKVGFASVVYCDTDSIFFERKYLYRVQDILGKEYGKFKIEKGTEDKGIPFQAIAPKAYLFVEKGYKLKIKNKGIPTRDILAQDGFSRMGAENESVSFISSNNLVQMIKSGKDYGRKAHRRMATVQSTTNGKIINDVWHPAHCELPTLASIRGDSTLNNTTPLYLQLTYDMILAKYGREGNEQ